MNQSGDEQAECPLCMEPFEVDDLNFFPCTCGYQICRFCWHRIRTDENGLCPACRKAYPENPADFKPLSQEQMAKLKAEKRQKEQQRKQKATESRKHLADVRVVQKNLVFVVGLPIRLAEPNVLKKHEYFGKFGKIQKVVINQSNTYAGALGPSASAYVTYHRYEDALRAIQAINNIWVDNRQIKTSLGTTKYCSHFIKAQTCPKSDCMYLHDLGDPDASFTKEEMHRGKHQEYERNLFEQFNSAISQERKTTPSPPVLGNSLPNSESTSSTFPTSTKEAWLSTQNGSGFATQNNPGGGTVTEAAMTTSEIISNVSSTTSGPPTNNSQSSSVSSSKQQSQSQSQQQPQQQSSKTKQIKEKNNNNSSMNEKSTSNSKKKGKEKSSNGTSNNQISNNNNNNSNNSNSNNNSSNSNNNSNNNHNNNNNNNNNHNSNNNMMANNNLNNSIFNGIGNGSGSNSCHTSNSSSNCGESNSNSNNNNSSNNSNSNNNKNNNNNVNVNQKHSESIGKDKNKEKDKKVNGDKIQVGSNSANNAKIMLSGNKSYYGKSNGVFTSNNFGKKSPTDLKESLPNGFIKLPENVSLDYESGFGDANSLSDKESIEGIDGKLLANFESERLAGSGENDTAEKCLVNGFQSESINCPFDKSNYNQRQGNGYGYQNGSFNFSNNISQQNLFNNYLSLNKFGGQIKNDNLLLDNNEVYLNQNNNHLLGQPNFLLKHQLAQQQQQQQQQPQQSRNQLNLQQIIIQQQNLYQQAQNQFSQDYRLLQQQSQQQQSQPQTLNGLHTQHFNYLQQSNLRDQLLLQQQQKQLILNSYPPTGNSFIHLPNSEDMVVVDSVIPQHKFSGLNHGNLYSSEFKIKDSRKGEESTNEKSGIMDNVGDDELGFDPFHETQKALADLMEKELLIQQDKQGLQHKNEQYYQSTQSYQNQHPIDNCQRNFNQLQVSMLNQQNNILGNKVKLSLLSQLQSQQLLNSSNSKSSGSNRLDNVRCTLPPPGFASPSQSGPSGAHLNSFSQGLSRSANNSRKIPSFLGLSNSESFQPHYFSNGISKSDDWPESLRSLVQEGRTSSPSTTSSYSSASKGWSNLGNCSDWTALDPAIVSSSRSPHLSIHSQPLINNQEISHLHQSHLQNQMRQLNIGSVLDHNNWPSMHRQNDDSWSSHIQTTIPPPGFSLPHTGGELKKPVISGMEGFE